MSSDLLRGNLVRLDCLSQPVPIHYQSLKNNCIDLIQVIDTVDCHRPFATLPAIIDKYGPSVNQ